jgi:hypothetical protein
MDADFASFIGRHGASSVSGTVPRQHGRLNP